MTNGQAKHFLAVWMAASSVEIAAACLQWPVLTVLRMAAYLRKRGVAVPYRPIEQANDRTPAA